MAAVIVTATKVEVVLPIFLPRVLLALHHGIQPTTFTRVLLLLAVVALVALIGTIIRFLIMEALEED